MLKINMIESITFFKKNRKDKKYKHSPNPEGDLTSEQKEARDIIVFYLHNGDMDNALKTKEKFNLPDEIVHEAAKNAIIYLLLNGGLDIVPEIKNDVEKIFKIKEKFGISDEALFSPKHRGVVIEQLLKKQAYQQLRKITEILGITDGEIQGIDAELLKLDVSAKDPYAEHEWLFNGEKIKRSVLLAKVLNGELGIEQVVLDFEIAESDLPRIKEALRMI